MKKIINFIFYVAKILIGAALTPIALFIILGALSFGGEGTAIMLLFAALMLVVGVACIVSAVKQYNGQVAKAKTDRNSVSENSVYCSSEELDQYLLTGMLPVFENTPIILADGETACYYGLCIYETIKNKAVGRTGRSGGASVRVAKGLTLRSGTGASHTIYEDVSEKYKGDIVVTNQRIIFLSAQKGFEIQKKDLVAITGPDGILVQLQTKRKAYRLYVSPPDMFVSAVKKS